MSNLTIDDGDSRFQYNGGWRAQENATQAGIDGYHNATYHSTCDDGNSVTLSWDGTGVALYHGARANKGYYSVLLDTRDANQKMYLDGYSANDIIPALMFNVTNLEFKTHFLIVTNEKNYNTTRFGCNGIDYAVLIGVQTGTAPNYGNITTTSSTSSSSSVAPNPTDTNGNVIKATGAGGNYTFVTAAPTSSTTPFQTSSNTKTAIGAPAPSLITQGTPNVNNNPIPTTMTVMEGSSGAGIKVGIDGSGAMFWAFMIVWVLHLLH